MTYRRTDMVHNADYLTPLYGQDFFDEIVDTPRGQWRREPDGAYRFWRPIRTDSSTTHSIKED